MPKSPRKEFSSDVHDRTAELLRLNTRLQAEIAERRQVEQALRESEERYRIVSRRRPITRSRSTSQAGDTCAGLAHG